MKTKAWWLAALVLGALVVVRPHGGCLTGGCLSGGKDPDQKLAAQIEDLCEIARAGAPHPVAGVRRLGGYLLAHAGDLLKNFADTIAAIERIADDAKHDDRARLARKRLVTPAERCAADWQRFADAIGADPEAERLVERALERLDRTFEIIFGNGGRARGVRALRDLPRELSRALDRR